MKKILILGGTAEASALTHQLVTDARLNIIYSLAGVTKAPVLPVGVTTKIGGFGGLSGMAEWLTKQQISAVLDATHPFAQQITHNAFHAAQATNLPFLRIQRPEWKMQEGDRWIRVYTMNEAVQKLGQKPARVFLTIGRKELLFFKECNVRHQYWIRSVDKPQEDYLPNNIEYIQAKGPFAEQDEIDFLQKNKINYIVSKSSGGSLVYSKIIAARKCSIPVIMVERPTLEAMPTVETWQEAYVWIKTIN